MDFYFIRANGNTAHNNPNWPGLYIPGEPPTFPDTYFNGLGYCFANNIVRIGWPGSGDLRVEGWEQNMFSSYNLFPPSSHVTAYLTAFQDIRPGSVILVPDKDHPGDIYIAEVTGSYDYKNAPPVHPYEHSHRFGVVWDRSEDNNPTVYRASEFGIGIIGGFWTRAFFPLAHSSDAASIIANIQTIRQSRGAND